MATGSKKVIFAALIGNALISITKFIAAFLTGSSAMLSEGIHSIVDTGNQGLLLYGIARAKRPADENFPFGHGKEIYFWSFIVAILIFALGGGISIYEGIKHISHPEPIENPLINYIVLGLAMVFEGAAWLFAFREFSRAKGKWGYVEAIQRAKDPSIFVVLFEDSAAMLGLMVAFAGVALTQLTGNLLFDGLASVIIGLILVGTAIWLAYETKGLLIGESANRSVVEGV
ncbi:MAG: cation diffusion facilitator family transporter, partial [Candidatus Thiodiazotropha sp. (ex Semelilucina semeliformis)]|nr:cation diffusion facilitator family transporter [Candidatus Thiodiazotropha sp. (ex Semelilucina semeliformis)]